jgi:hypothetical protein
MFSVKSSQKESQQSQNCQSIAQCKMYTESQTPTKIFVDGSQKSSNKGVSLLIFLNFNQIGHKMKK